MEIKKHNNKKKIIIAVIVIVAIAAGVAGAWFLTRRDQNNDQQNETQTAQDQTNNESDNTSDNSDSDDDSAPSDTSTDTQSDDQESNLDNDPTNGGKTPPRYEGGYAQNSETLTGDISGISIVGNNLSVRVTINQFITDPEGRCELTLTSPSGATYQYWSELVQNPQTTSCYGWDIPTSELSGNVSGHWSATVTVNGDGRTGTFTSEVDL